MTKKEALVALWRLFVELFGDAKLAARLAAQAGLDPAKVDASGSPADYWWRIIVAAHHREKIQALVNAALWEMDEREADLKAAFKDYTNAREADEPLGEPGVPVPLTSSRSITTHGDVKDSVLNTGDNNVINKNRKVDTGGGAYIGGGVNVSGGDFVGRDKITTVSSGVDLAQLTVALAPVMSAIQQAPPPQKQEAQQKAQALKTELAKGKDAKDETIADLIKGLVDLVPGAVSAVTGAFAAPLLAGLTGPVTKWVLKSLSAGS